MTNFSVNLLKPHHAILAMRAQALSLNVLMQAFILDGTLISSEMQLDGVDLPSSRLAELVGQTFDFPLNPADGYIDASIYLDQRHHPIDIKRLEFHANRHGGASVLIRGTYLFEYEGWGELKNTDFVFNVAISSAVL